MPFLTAVLHGDTVHNIPVSNVREDRRLELNHDVWISIVEIKLFPQNT